MPTTHDADHEDRIHRVNRYYRGIWLTNILAWVSALGCLLIGTILIILAR